MPVYQVLKQGKKQLTRTDIELIVTSKMNQKCKENAVAIAKALSTPGDVESIKGLLGRRCLLDRFAHRKRLSHHTGH